MAAQTGRALHTIKMKYYNLELMEGVARTRQRSEHKELLKLNPEGGMVRFAGLRAVLLDAMAMGLHRKHLVENFGRSDSAVCWTICGLLSGYVNLFEFDEFQRVGESGRDLIAIRHGDIISRPSEAVL